MDHPVDPFRLQRRHHSLFVLKIRLDEDGFGSNGVAMSALQVVVHDDVMAVVDEHIRHHAADVAGTAGHEKSHCEKKCK